MVVRIKKEVRTNSVRINKVLLYHSHKMLNWFLSFWPSKIMAFKNSQFNLFASEYQKVSRLVLR